MISYLKGTVAGIVKSSSRITLILEVNSLGYELQIPARLAQQLSAPSETVQIFTHLQVREEQPFLYGFGSASERDLFRQLLSVSGIGGAIAIALLDTLEVPDLVQAIVSGNTQMLIQTPGVGGKTAERISLELKTKLADWRIASGLTVAGGSGPPRAIVEEVQLTLLALGYTPNEVAQALSAVSQQALLAKNANAEDWIRQAIAHLSNT